MNNAIGSCFCKEVEFSVALPAKWVAHCHCDICKQLHSSAFVTWLGIDEQNFKFNRGNELVEWYQSSEGAERGRCKSCGTPLFFTSERWKGEIHVVRTAFVSNDIAHPMSHVYYDRHTDWFPIEDELPKLGGETGTEKI